VKTPTQLRILTLALWMATCAVRSSAQGTGAFVSVANGGLALNGSAFRFGGTNSYALMLESQAMVDQVLETAASSHFTALRMWAFDDAASASSSFYLQNFAGGSPQYNDGATGLANVDYAIYKAGQLGLKLIIPFVNNWPDYGGMDVYVGARGLTYHDQFYTDPTVRQWYKSWISHVLNHVNTISGVAYKDEPTIMIWELANEPRCQGTGLPSSGTCTNQTIVSWISDVASYVKSADGNHLVSVGDEGFFCGGTALPNDNVDNCATGVDSVSFSQIPSVDVIGFHLYPDSWDENITWAEQFIEEHLSAGQKAAKPVYMGEFGSLEGNIRNTVFQDWTGLIFQGTGSGALFWDLLPGQPTTANAESLGAFDVEAGSPILTAMGNFAQNMSANSSLTYSPVAGDQWATGFYNAPVTLYPLGNDVAFGGATINASSIDLDPNTPGWQTTFTSYGGSFAVVGQSVQFTPSAGFNGLTECAYTVADSSGNVSNTAYLLVTVNPSPSGSDMLESFELGPDGLGPLGGSGAAGSVAQTTAFHTDGSYGLQVNVTAGGWFGAALSSPMDLSGRPSLSIDVQSSLGGQSAIAFQSGAGGVWCQNAQFPALASSGITTVTVPLNASQLQCFSASGPTFSEITAVYVYFSSPGTYYLDNLRAAPVTNQQSTPTLPSITGVSNSASGQSGAASGSYFSIYGANFAPAGSATATWSGWVVEGNLPTSLAGVSVTVGGQGAYIYTVGPNQINAVAPGLTDGPSQVVVTTAAGNSAPFAISAQALQPAFFLWGTYVVATYTDYSLAVPNGTFDVPTVAAKPGDVVVLWGTGFGTTSPAAPIGQEVPPATFPVPGVTVTVGNTAAMVYGTALAPGLAGVYQVAIQVPSGLTNGTYPLVATVNGVQSPAASLVVQQ
jgi:mannan endo-1,4-beta-mannosidase